MINKIQFLQGFPLDLPQVGKRIFNFDENFNVLFGNNGTGKSVILKTIKAYCGIEKGGWTRLSDEIKLPATSPDHFPATYSVYTPNNCIANVDWDGKPTFYNEGDIKVDGLGWFFDNQQLSDDGITTGDEHLDTLATKPSSGQYRLKKLNKIFNILENPPKISGSSNEAKYIKSLPRNGKITVLFDEPERALSLPKQMELFELLRDISDKYQVIVATHSPFILFQEGVNIIDMEDEYSLKCIEIFKGCVKQYLERKYKISGK
jgi:ABC-type lipoprotein export system ATPase subunit